MTDPAAILLPFRVCDRLIPDRHTSSQRLARNPTGKSLIALLLSRASAGPAFRAEEGPLAAVVVGRWLSSANDSGDVFGHLGGLVFIREGAGARFPEPLNQRRMTVGSVLATAGRPRGS